MVKKNAFNGVFAGARRWLVVAVALTLTAGCVVNPVTGANEIAIVSDASTNAMGAEQYGPAQQLQGGAYILDPALSDYVSQIGNRIGVTTGVRLPYEFVVVNDSSVNAWALPGGKIGINRGLLLMMDNEAELAAVLAHEIAHAAARHGAQRVNRAALTQLGLTIASAGLQIAGFENGGQLVGIAQETAQFLSLNYSREAEREADFYGAEFMAKSGYDPEAAVTLQRKFVGLAGPRGPAILQSHPSSEERVNNNQRRSRALQEKGYVQGRLGTEAYRRATATLRRHADAYTLYDDARKLYAEKSYSDADILIGQALQAYPQEALFHGLRGSIRLQQRRHGDAVTHFSDALQRNRDYYLFSLGRGLAYRELGNGESARRDLEASVRLLPTAGAYQTLAAIAEEQGDGAKAQEYRVLASQFQ